MVNTLSAYARAILVEGQTVAGVRVPILVAADGTLQRNSAASQGSNVTTSYDRATLLCGQTSTGLRVPILINSNGSLA